MVSFRQKHGALLRPRLQRLQEVQEEIYRQMHLLLPDAIAHHDWFLSRVSGSPLLRMDILERHAYTLFIRLTYSFRGEDDGRHVPDAHIRLYRDARIAEVTAFDPRQGCRRTAHPWFPARPLMQKTWRQNLALDKWLGYLLGQGHSVDTMRPAKRCISDEEARWALVPAV